MTWKEFKEAVEKQGVLDTDELAHIDYTSWSEDANKLLIWCDEYDGKREVTIEEDWCGVQSD